ncbi:hypothetical protein [Bacillus bombysepticus]|uniref:hypothetical protein n=1 Tax=Bacillus bombysepticus TaxID=658666 RepID=UPI00301B5EE2
MSWSRLMLWCALGNGLSMGVLGLYIRHFHSLPIWTSIFPMVLVLMVISTLIFFNRSKIYGQCLLAGTIPVAITCFLTSCFSFFTA